MIPTKNPGRSVLPGDEQAPNTVLSSLKILIIEDVVEDVELILMTLGSANILFSYDQVSSAEACSQLLQHQCYDIVLSDYRLPCLNGLQALELVKASGQDIPFILVTGSLGEEAAVACIKAGMTDYVLKERLFRLPSVLERALQEFELRRQQKVALAQIQQQARQERIVNQIVQAMRQTLVLTDVLQTTVDQLHDVLEVSRCTIFQPNTQSDTPSLITYVSRQTKNRESFLGIPCDLYTFYQSDLMQDQAVIFDDTGQLQGLPLYEMAESLSICSFVLMPLLYQKSYFGGICLQQCDRQRTWTPEEVILVKSVADQCAIAIHQAQLYEQAQKEILERQRIEAEQALLYQHLQQKAQQDSLLVLITERIRQSLGLQTILEVTVNEVRQVLNVDRVIILRLEKEGSGRVVAEAVTDPSLSILNQVIVPIGFTGLSHLSQMDPVSFGAGVLEDFQVRSQLIVSIFQGDQHWGLLIAHQCTEPKVWENWMSELLHRLSHQLEIALQQAQLVLDLEDSNKELRYQVEVRNKELLQIVDYEALLRDITDEVRKTLNQEEILQTTVKKLCRGLNLGSCVIGLFDQDLKTYKIASQEVGVSANLLELDLSAELLSGSLLQEGQSAYYSFQSPSQGQVTVITSPIQDDQKVLGFISLIRSYDQEFNPYEIRLVEQVANQCGIGIRQARLYQSVQEQVQQLTQLNLVKEEFLNMVSHELRTPLTSMRLALQMIEIAGLSDKQLRYYTILKSEWQRELDLVNDLLDLQNLESGKRRLTISMFRLQDWIQSFVDPFYLRSEERQLSFRIQLPDEPIWLNTDQALLTRILSELMNNALKYTPPQETIQVELLPTESELWIRVTNTGVVIPEEHLPHLFEKFYRVPKLDQYNQGGTGLGLSLIQKAVDLIQGQIHVNSGDGLTRFTIHIPLSLSCQDSPQSFTQT
jgi:GAF domain-containing protein